MSESKRPDALDKLLCSSVQTRALILAIVGGAENLFTFGVYCYLGIWDMAVVTLIGLFAFILCARSAKSQALTIVHLTVLTYAIVAVLLVSVRVEWAYGFQNYLFVPVQLCFALVYHDANFKTVLKYAITTIVLVACSYCVALYLNAWAQPQTIGGPGLIGFVNGMNAFFVSVLGFMVLVYLFVELHKESSAVQAANQRLAYLAVRDPLTNLYNRRFANELLQQKAAGDPAIALVICDIDHFKLVNDSLGHDMGDLVLDYFARILLSNIGFKDHAIRWGGEEFLLIIDDPDIHVACRVVERIIAQMQANPFTSAGKSLLIKFTAGIALYTPGDGDVEEALKTADRRLYYGKEAGRNRYVAAG